MSNRKTIFILCSLIGLCIGGMLFCMLLKLPLLITIALGTLLFLAIKKMSMSTGEPVHVLIIRIINTLAGLMLIIGAFPVGFCLSMGASGPAPLTVWVLFLSIGCLFFAGFGVLARHKYFWHISIFLLFVYCIDGIYTLWPLDFETFLMFFAFPCFLLLFLLFPQVKRQYK